MLRILEYSQARKHALVQDATDKNSITSDSIDDDVLLVLNAPVPCPDLIRAAAHLRILDEPPEASFQPVKVSVGLFLAPHVLGVIGNFDQVEASKSR